MTTGATAGEALAAFRLPVGSRLGIAVPVGPIGLSVIGHPRGRGFAVGLATGLGAAVADAVHRLGVAGLVGARWAAFARWALRLAWAEVPTPV